MFCIEARHEASRGLFATAEFLVYKYVLILLCSYMNMT